MSTLKVTNIESPSGGGVNAKITDINGGQLGNRNLIINGAMQVSQRSTSTAVTTTDTFVLDRFRASSGSSFNFNSTISQSSTAPAGFVNSYKVDVTTASTPTGSQNGVITHVVEAQNLQHLQYGASTAQTCTLTFWVRSNKTGTYCLQILHHDADKYQLHEYTISSADTWEQKTITIVGNTANAITNDTGIGLQFRWHLASGPSDHVSASSTWTGSSQSYFTTSNQVNLFDNTSNEWYLTGVQLETGEVATAFEHRSYGDELQRCLRYTYVLGSQNVTDNYERFDLGICNSSTTTRVFVKHPVVMRTAPTVSTPDASQFQVSDTMTGYDASALSRMSSTNGPLQTSIQVTHQSGATTNRVYILERNNSTSGRITFDAEL
jgi:hypothetical protein